MKTKSVTIEVEGEKGKSRLVFRLDEDGNIPMEMDVLKETQDLIDETN